MSMDQLEDDAVSGDVVDQLSELERLTKMAGDDFDPPPGAESAPSRPVANIDTAMMCERIVEVLFAIVSQRRGDHWILQKKESEMLGGALGAVLDKYAPDYQGGPEAALLIAVAMICGPRIAQDVNIKEAASSGDKTERQPSQ